MGGLGRLDGFAERGIVDRHVAPAEQHQLLVPDLIGNDALDDVAPCGLARHEQRADRVVAGLRQLEADLRGLALEEGVRNLHQNAGAVAGARIGANRATMLEIAQNVERVGDDLVRLLALDVGDEADAAGILFQAGIVETLGGRTPAVFALRNLHRFRGRGRRQRIRHDVFALELRPAHLSPLTTRLRASPSSAHLGRCGTHRATARPPRAAISEFRPGVQRPRGTALPFYFLAPEHPTFVAIPVPGLPPKLRQ